MQSPIRIQLTLAILATLALAGNAIAQDSDTVQANTVNETQAAVKSADADAPSATAAAEQAQDAAAQAAAGAAQDATQMAPPSPPAAPAPEASASGEVNVTSHPGNSISSNYHVDFDAMDSNHDGNISRAEAKGNADLMREFRVVDGNHNGRLSKEEMSGWLD